MTADQPASEPAVAAVTTLLRPLALSWLLWLLSLSLSVSAAARRSSSMSLPERHGGTQGLHSKPSVHLALRAVQMESFSGFALTWMLFIPDCYNINESFCHTILIMFIVLSFCLSIFLSLLLLVVMVVFLSCYSFYDFNLRYNREETNEFYQKNNTTLLGFFFNSE